MSAGYRTLHLDDIPTVEFDDDVTPTWKPVRRQLGVAAFGTNAYVAEEPGDVVVERHDELPEEGSGLPGQQELYLVLAGSARFEIGDEVVDLPARGIVFIEDPALVRRATALERQTVVFAVGAPQGAPFEPSAWEEEFLRRGRTAE
ncbi:MAG: hypothetical protein LT070_07820 [Solirubrobacteraceae bacterium]|nr:hypothetical protein [Solirubrobacteraceae bacterium]